MFDEIRKRLIDSNISPTDLRIVLDILEEAEKAQKKHDGE